MESLPRVFVDFNNTDKEHRVRLTTVGTRADLERLQITLVEDLILILDDGEGLVIRGIVQFSEAENIWVAVVDWDELMSQE